MSQQLGHTDDTLKYYARWIVSGQVHRFYVLDGVNAVTTPAATFHEVAASVSA